MRCRSLICLVLATSVLGGLAFASHADTPSGDAGDLPGTYYDSYPALFGNDAEIRTVEKYLTIRATKAPNLFLYFHCWRLVDGGGGWNRERGGLVVTSLPDEMVAFSVAEVDPRPTEGSTGLIQGQMLSPGFLDYSYYGVGHGIVFRSKPQLTDNKVDDSSCPVE